MLDLYSCRIRQQRLRAALEQQGAGAAVLTSPAAVYYFSGILPDARLPQVLVVTAAASLLVTSSDAPSAADRSVRYTSYSLDRVVSRASMMAEVGRALAAAPELAREQHVAMEADWLSASLRDALSAKHLSDITPALSRLRRRKDPDEIAQMRKVVAIAEAGYARMKGAVKVGNTELDVFNAATAGVVEAAGTQPFILGDFACGTRHREGGAPTRRTISEGDLFILDFFPGYDGYRADLCRTFAASTVSDLQQRAWEHVRAALALTDRTLKPGLGAAEFYRTLHSFLDEFEPARGSFYHHAGHGIGLDAQEFPWLTPGSDHVLEEGDVVAVEPGLYSDALQGGIRLEQNYLVTATGCESLSKFPLEMA